MKKIVILASALFLVFFHCFADENSTQTPTEESKQEKRSDFHLSFSPIIGYKTGEANEFVYSKNSSGDYRKLSQLKWEQKNKFFAGVGLSTGWKRININLNITGIFAGRCGNMYDSDWLDLNNVKNDYSISENTFTSGTNFNAEASFTFKPLNKIWISPNLSFDYHYFEMEARNGYGWYGDSEHNDQTGTKTNVSWDDSSAHYFPVGTLFGIDYNRHSYLAWIGCTISYMPLDWLSMTLSPSISPVLYLISRDHHYNKAYYADETIGFFKAFKFSSSASFKINKIYSIIATVDFYKIWTLQGDTYYSVSGDYNYSHDTNADEQYFSTTVSWKINIL